MGGGVSCLKITISPLTILKTRQITNKPPFFHFYAIYCKAVGYKYKVKPQISRYFTKGKPQLVLSLSCHAFNSLTITPACFVNVPLLVLQLLYTGLTEHFYFKNRCRFVDLGHRWFCGFTWLSTSQMLMSF